MTTAQQDLAPTIDEPGVYTIPDERYHADPVPGRSLSCSGAKRLLPPSCPAVFRHEQLHGRPNRSTFDFGHAAHKLVLGVGAPLAVIAADDWRTKAAQQARAEAYAVGAVPLLDREHQVVTEMAAALRRDPLAAALLDPELGQAEQSLFTRDPNTGVMLRSRLDWLPQPDASGRVTLVDYKTALSAEPGAITRAVASYGYHQQHAWYVDIVRALGLAEDVAFRFVFQEKTAPYLVTVVELDDEAVAIGRVLNRTAIDLYADCVKRDRWPGYAEGVELISLPPWATYEHDLDVI